jgi:hypothetical protein
MPESWILYACPVGALADQLDQYFAASLKSCGQNAAHHYMPHCTLTGFFPDESNAVELYLAAITQALNQQFAIAPHPHIKIISMDFQPDWHGLVLQSTWLQELTILFTQLAQSPTRSQPIRLKSWLHLSLAYEFLPEQAPTLKQLAQTYIHPQSPVAWELRFYQRHFDAHWTCHQSWSLLP